MNSVKVLRPIRCSSPDRVPLLSILIATTTERESQFKDLIMLFLLQIDSQFEEKVEIIAMQDNKEISIGRKRQLLLEQAKGKFIVFFDDDDFPYSFYVKTIVSVIQNNPDIDCIGLVIDMTTDLQNHQTCFHSLQNKEWRDGFKVQDKYDYYRNVTHFNPVRRDLALQVGFPDLRFGEDKDYSDRISLLCKKEYMIDMPLWHYKFSTNQKHNEKYGIK